MSKRSLCRSVLAAALALVALPAAAPAAERLFTVTPTNRLLEFQSDKPAEILSSVRINGLQSGEEVTALDFRPATATLFGVTNRNRITQINPSSGQARPLTADAFAPPLSSEGVGFDFNPTVDLIRVVTAEDQNLRVSPVSGRTTSTDPPLRYASDDPAAGVNPLVTAEAYTRPFPGAGTTRLFGIDSSRRTLVVQEPANAGTLRTVAPLTLGGRQLRRVVGPIGFDIAESGRALVSLRLGGETGATLFGLNLSTGRLRPLGPVGPIGPNGSRTQGLAAAGQVPDDERAPDVILAAPQDQRLRNVLRRGLRLELSCSEACIASATLSIGRRLVARGAVVINPAGKGNLRFVLDRAARRRVLASDRRRLVLRAVVTDFAGNARVQRENITLR